MRKRTLCTVSAAVLFGMTAAQAGEFVGAYAGGKIGANRTDMTDVSKKSAAATGLEVGYNWDMDGMLLGVDGFVDFNAKKTHSGGAGGIAPASVNYGSRVYGLDLKLGLPNGNWMPYAKLGYARTDGRGDPYASAIGDGGAHLGLGVEYKFAPQWSVVGEWTNGDGKSGTTELDNDNFTIGVNYYFDKPIAAPVAAPAPVAMKEEPKAAPAPEPAPSETWKTLLENKPVCIEGTNFEFDSARLRTSEIRKLDEVASFAEKHPDVELEASGHTCSLGAEAYNQKLSERRAESVKAYLVNKGVAAQRIVTVGHGESRPMADNRTREGREQNRRVEVCTVLTVETRVRD
jgi:OOP family OmpA-OmpF porin